MYLDCFPRETVTHIVNDQNLVKKKCLVVVNIQVTVIQNLIDISSVINNQTKNNLNMVINQARSSTSILLTSHWFLVYLSYLFPFALIGCCDNFAFSPMKLK